MPNKKEIDRYNQEAMYNQVIEDQSVERLGMKIPQYMVHREKQNGSVSFGFSITNDGLSYIGKPQDKDGHVLVVGGAGSGKSSCIAIPTLRSWTGTFFAIDIKGELLQNAAGFMKSPFPVKVFSFSKEREANLKYCRYDPFCLLREGNPDDLVQNAREIAQAIIPVPLNVREPFWCEAAQNVLTAAILYVFGLQEPDPNTGELLQGTFNDVMNLIQSKPIWELIKDIGNSENEAAIMLINQFRKIKFPDDNKMLAGIGAELSNRVMVFATDNRIRAAFAEDDNMMKWEDLENHNIFMQIPEDKLGQWDGAITMMLTQLIRTLERRPDKYSGKEKLPPVLLLLDEFPRLGKLDVIQNAVSTLRSKGVTICMIIQSLAQLDKTYGEASRKNIVDNCPYISILNVNDPEDQKIFSDIIGSINVRKTSINDGSSINFRINHASGHDNISKGSDREAQGISRNISTNFSVVREPIIFPHELAKLKDIILLTPEGFCRVAKLPYYGL